MKRLVLFDIDETMIHSYGVGRSAIKRALNQAFSMEVDIAGYSLSGKTDPQIFLEVLLKNGLEEAQILATLEKIIALYLAILPDEIRKAETFCLHPGVRQLLKALEEAPWAYLGLLTGNIEAGARLKLAPFRLNSFFKIGAYGSDEKDRMKLPPIAHSRATNFFGQKFQVREIVIIGDSPADILCAQNYGARCIAVNTGQSSQASLAELEPEFLFESLGDTEAVVTAITGK